MLYAGGANQYTYQLYPATDWTSLTGSSITLGLSSYEGLVLFSMTASITNSVRSQRPTVRATLGQVLYEHVSVVVRLASPASFWPSGQSAPAVGYIAEPTGIVQVQNLVATGFILIFDVQDAYESTINMYHARTCRLPISTVASGNAVNDSRQRELCKFRPRQRGT